MFTFSVRMKILFLSKFDPKIQNGLFKLKFGLKTNSNRELYGDVYFFWFALEKPSSSSMWNSATMFIFSVLQQKYNFWKNWSHIIKSVVGFALSCLIWLSPVFVSVTKIKFLKMFQLCRAFR